MPATADLKEIADAIGFNSDEDTNYFDTETGDVVSVSNSLLRAAENEDDDLDLPSWQDGEWETAQDIVSTDRYLPLPASFDVHEWQIMQDFASSVESPRVSAELNQALHGAGAFRHFKATIRRHAIEQDWYKWRDAALERIAADWCTENGIAWK